MNDAREKSPRSIALLLTAAAWATVTLLLAGRVVAKPRVDATERKRMRLTLAVLIALTVLAYGFAAYWLFLPIHMLGTTV